GRGGGSAGAAGRGGASGAGASAGASGRGGGAGTGGAAGTTGSGGGAQPYKGVANSPCAVRTMLKTSWYYNWTQSADTCAAAQGGEFVPMIWGHTGNEQSATGIASSITSFVGKGYGNVLGFNEPDNSGQANMSVATAIALWPSFNNPAIKIGSPATSANSAGQTWFQSFMNMLNADASLRADFVAIHWYGWNAGSCDAKASQLESYLKSAEGWAGTRPIWLTEWGCLNDSAPDTQTVVTFYNAAVTMFAKHPRLVRYAWYPWSTNLDLVDSGGALTALGVAYAAAPSTR
ncbi:MAG TPA: glycosyl hydrolase, partial [Polyangia bacterium]